MIKKLLKVVTVILAFLVLVFVVFVVSLRLYYLHIVRQTPGKLPVPVQSGALGSNVNVFSGSGGWFYVCAHNGPAAMTPFGMVRLGPDTACMLLDKNGLNTSGYYYGDNKLLGFSHTRFIGTGMHQGCNLRVLPTVASHAGKLLGLPREKRWVRFSHSQETGFPGYYAVHLPGDEVLAELTATPHAGFHRYTFQKDEPPHLILDVSSVLENRAVLDGSLAIAPEKNEVSGMMKVHGGSGVGGGLDLYYVGRFSRPFAGYSTWKGKQVQAGNKEITGVDIGADLSFARDAANPTVEFQVAFSYVSAANARLNFDAEAAKSSFDEVAKAAREAWEARLATIQVTGGTKTQQRVFYTALFRCFEMPTRFADVNGEYIGFDQKVHKQEGFQYYTDFSLWDTFRTVHPLYTLIALRRPARHDGVAHRDGQDRQGPAALARRMPRHGQHVRHAVRCGGLGGLPQGHPRHRHRDRLRGHVPDRAARPRAGLQRRLPRRAGALPPVPLLSRRQDEQGGGQHAGIHLVGQFDFAAGKCAGQEGRRRPVRRARPVLPQHLEPGHPVFPAPQRAGRFHGVQAAAADVSGLQRRNGPGLMWRAAPSSGVGACLSIRRG